LSIRMVTKHILTAVLVVVISACAQQGGVRTGTPPAASTDMEDSTGNLGEEKRWRTGAGDIYVKLALDFSFLIP